MSGHAAKLNGIATEATTATTSNARGHASARDLMNAVTTTPPAKANPIAVAATECSTSSTRSTSSPAIQGRCENTAAAINMAPKLACRAVANGPHGRVQMVASRITDSPKRTNPERASQAPCTLCAADSLVVCDTQE